ncbi:MAG: Gldg family protein [Pseudomonadales bacterium]
MNTAKLFSKAGLVVLALITLLLVGLLNVSLRGARIDLTDDQLYTVSSGTVDMLQTLENPVTLEFFFSDKLTADLPQLRDFARRVRELLEEMAIKSNGQVTLKVIDPEPFSEEEDRAAELGLQSTPLSLGGPEIYLGLAASNASDNSEIIEFLQPEREQYLEYDVAKMLHIVGRDKAPKVAMLAGLQVSGGFDMQTRQPTPAWMAISQLQQMFDVVTLDDGFASIEDDVDVLILIHPPELQTPSRYAIDQFVLRGGNLIAFVDPNAEQAGGANPMMPSPGAANSSSNMKTLFQQWGFELAEAKVLGDVQHALQVGSPRTGQPVRHLGILGYDTASFDKEDIVVRDLNLLHFGTAGVLKPLADSALNFQPLVLSSNQSMLLDASKFEMMMDPNALFEGFVPDGQHHVIAARVRGGALSAFPDGAPEPEAAEAAETTEPEQAEAENVEAITPNRPHLKQSSEDINLLVVADTDFLSNRLWIQVQNFFGQQIGSPFADNGSFLINAVENMIGNTDLISTRSRGEYVRRFERVDELRLQAEQNFRTKEESLQQSLAATEAKLAELQAQKSDDGAEVLTLSPEQLAEVEKFQQEKLSIRKQLREVQHQLGSDIEALGTQLKLINIALIPVLLTVLALLFRVVRRGRS